ncbi:MAG: polysaccharide biosynthesis/export family protein [Phycisphaeraceae bacterium]|nr:polysaccharide biosynthesis/export family protein [Phycisphaeraceae bacterium]
MRTSRAMSVAVAVLVAVGCAATPTGPGAGGAGEAGPAVAARPYHIGIGDRLQMIAPTIPELTDLEAAVREDGYIRLPLLGEVFAAGRSPAQLGSEIQEKLHRYYVAPALRVRVSLHDSQYWFAESGDVRVKMPYTGADHPRDALKVLNRGGRVGFVLWRADESGRLQQATLDGQPLETGDVVRLTSGGGLALSERGSR